MNDAQDQRYARARRRALRAWIALLVLLALSAGSVRLHLGAGNTVISFGIAAVKIAIVAWVFMGLREKHPLLRIVAAAGVAALVVMAVLSWVDLGFRAGDASCWQAPEIVGKSAAKASATCRTSH